MKLPVVLSGFLLVSVTLRARADDANVAAIIQKCVTETRKSVRLRTEYTYKIMDETKNLDRSGEVKDTHWKTVEVVYFAGKPYERVMDKDGKPLPPGEQKREEEKVDRAAEAASKLTAEEREARQAKLDQEREKSVEWLQYFPKAYNFTLQAADTLNGRPTYVMEATPKGDYRGKYSSMLTRAKCRLFVDKSDYTLARIEAQVLQPITFGFFLARLAEGSRITFEQVRVNDEVWLPKNVTVHADARALVKTFRIDERLTFSDYRKFQSESRIVSAGER